MDFTKVYTDASFQNAIVPVGTKLIFLGYQDGQSGQVTLRYKDSQGFHNLVGSASQQSAAGAPIQDAGDFFTEDTIQGALQQLGSKLGDIHTALGQITGDTTQSLAQIVGE